MAVVACPYCYTMIDNCRLAYQCLGKGSPGRRGCLPFEDPARETTGFVGRSLPVFELDGWWRPATGTTLCPTCRGETGVRACPSCHTPLPTTFVGGTSPLVGMVGGAGSGKTVYLTVLKHQLTSSIRRRFRADVRLSGDRQDGERSTRDYLDRYERALFDERRLFPPTSESSGRKQPIVVEWRRRSRTWLGRPSHDTTMLSFYDTAGEDMKEQGKVHTQRYLGVASGLIVLLDPWQLPQVRDQLEWPEATSADERPLDVLGRVTELLRATGAVRPTREIQVPVAVAFAKVDALQSLLGDESFLLTPSIPTGGYDEEEGKRVHDEVAGLLDRFGADDIDAHLRSNYARYRYFAVSALGAQPDYETLEVDPGGVQPLRVDEPLLWLLHQLKVLDRSAA